MNKTRFLFWNLNRRPLAHLVREVALNSNIDMIVLAECTESIFELLVTLNSGLRRQFALTDELSDRFVLLSRLPEGTVTHLFDGLGVSIRRIAPPLSKDLLLVAVHLPSKLFESADDQAMHCTRIRRYIEDAEEAVEHQRTAVVGDFNMDPFETGLVAAETFHAVMDRRVAMRHSRVVKDETRYFFYNPMWSRLGDRSTGPPGTYYYNSGKQMSFFWHTFDQVLVRSSLVNSFDDADLVVHTSAGSASLLRPSGVPDGSSASDHLPLSFALDLRVEEFR